MAGLQEKEMEEDQVTVFDAVESDTEEPHMKAIGLSRPPLPKAPGPFRSKREEERLVRNKFRKKSRKNRGRTWQ